MNLPLLVSARALENRCLLKLGRNEEALGVAREALGITLANHGSDRVLQLSYDGGGA